MRFPFRWIWLQVFLLGAFPPGAVAGVPEPAPAKCSGEILLLDGEFPPPPEGDRGFDVLHYDLDFRLDPTSSRISGTVLITAASLQDGLDTVQLDLVDDLTCLSIVSNGQDLLFAHADDALLAYLTHPVPRGQTFSLQVAWEGRPPRHGEMLVGLLFRRHNAGTLDDPTDDVPIIANLSEPWSAHSWWPCKDHPADKALVSTAVTVPDTLSAVCNGTLLGIDPVEPGWDRYRWREEYPLATYLVGVAVSNYDMWSEDCPTPGGSVPLQYHVFPQDRARAEYDFAPTCDMMNFMTRLTGPYPFAGEKYAQVEIKWTGAMEHTTATSISQFLITGDGKYETLVLHELAHHWFGDSLTPGAWADIWLNEGFARYCEALWIEETRGAQAYVEFMAEIGRERHPGLFVGQGLLGDPDPILPNLLVYDKGAWLLHSLRMLMGDGPFFGFLRAYAGDPDLVQGTVRREDMMAAAEVFAGRDLGGFFSPWLETDAVPEVWWETRLIGGDLQLAVHQLQDPLFELAVPVSLETDCGPVEQMISLTRRDQLFALEAPCPVRSVTVDPDSVVFMFRGQAQPRLLTVSGPAPNPMGSAGGDFEIFLANPSHLVVNIYDIRGRNIREIELGPVEATGPETDPESVPVLWTLDPEAIIPRAAAGVYWVEFKANPGRVVRKLTLIR